MMELLHTLIGDHIYTSAQAILCMIQLHAYKYIICMGRIQALVRCADLSVTIYTAPVVHGYMVLKGMRKLFIDMHVTESCRG